MIVIYARRKSGPGCGAAKYMWSVVSGGILDEVELHEVT